MIRTVSTAQRNDDKGVVNGSGSSQVRTTWARAGRLVSSVHYEPVSWKLMQTLSASTCRGEMFRQQVSGGRWRVATIDDAQAREARFRSYSRTRRGD